MKKVLTVNGMSCSHCEKSVREALGDVQGVTEVIVDLKTKLVTVEGENLDDDIILSVVEEIGFEPSNIK